MFAFLPGVWEGQRGRAFLLRRCPPSARMSPTRLSLGGLHACIARFRFTWFRCSAGLADHFSARQKRLQGQTVLAVVLEDEPLLGSLGDGQLCRALRTFCALHDFFAQLVVAQLS